MYRAIIKFPTRLFVAFLFLLPAGIAIADDPPPEKVEKLEPPPNEPPLDVPKEIVKLFAEGQYPVDAAELDPKVEYRFYKPVAEAGKKYPLIVWLHGYGFTEIANRNFGQLQNMKATVAAKLKDKERARFYMLVPQRPEKIGSWQNMLHGEAGSEKPGFIAAEALFGIIEQLKKDYPIDDERVSVVGISAGGSEGWTLVRQRPDLFASFAPIAVKQAGFDQLEKFEGISVWAFYSRGDRPGNAHEVIQQLNQVGGWGYYTEVDSFEHNCWNAAFSEYGLLEWLLKQEKGVYKYNPSLSSLAPVLKYWPQLTVATVCLLGWYVVRRRNARKLPNVPWESVSLGSENPLPVQQQPQS